MLGGAHIEKVKDDDFALSRYGSYADDLSQGFEGEHVRGDASAEDKIFALGAVVLFTPVEYLFKSKGVFGVASACYRSHLIAEIAGRGIWMHRWADYDFVSG